MLILIISHYTGTHFVYNEERLQISHEKTTTFGSIVFSLCAATPCY